MAYQTLTEFNATAGMFRVFLYVANVVPIFIPMVLFTFFTIVTLGVYFSQKRLSGYSNIFVGFAVAGYATFAVAFVMRLIPNLINEFTFIITIVVAVLCTLMLLVSNRE